MEFQDTYQALRRVLGDQIESFQSIELVERYRQYFKPTNVRVVLLAESHVFTEPEDMDIKIPRISYPVILPHPGMISRAQAAGQPLFSTCWDRGCKVAERRSAEGFRPVAIR